jgi:hypothetical protein
MASPWLLTMAGPGRNVAVDALKEHTMMRTGLLASLSLLLLAAPAWAADTDPVVVPSIGEFVALDASVASDPTLSVSASLPLGASLARGAARPFGADLHASRGVALPVLYGTLAGLQAYDGWTTVKAVHLGATEGNPAVAGLASNAHAMWAVKAGATLGSIYIAERLWRQHRRGAALVTMLAVNGVMAAVAVNNASVMQGLK